MNGLVTEGLGTRPAESTLVTDGFGGVLRRVYVYLCAALTWTRSLRGVVGW